MRMGPPGSVRLENLPTMRQSFGVRRPTGPVISMMPVNECNRLLTTVTLAIWRSTNSKGRVVRNTRMKISCLIAPSWWHSRVSFSTVGLIFLFGAVVSTFTGKTLARGRGVIDRNKEPREFWWAVTFYYLAAIFSFYCQLFGRPW